ncbi:tumor necrosis factor receptor superfamily member 6 isoform X2 [Gouania willdenowi]|uniref:tumor necrosis factor receptor superfamily member 6 isoform X2 n=1 Tax=Gouania willdenowi TaxID=441366 RepID=UPI001055E9F6|nr:tumor necrosis factor receptor superfamily member 6-like isoform X2 [Gouania willdenowi]
MKNYTLLFRFIILFVIFLQVSQAHGSVSVGKFRRGPNPESARRRRETCPHGSYDHEGRTCCLCAAGQYLTKHCTVSPDDRKCEQCVEGTYNSHPNNQETCLPCTSCSHQNANLEVATACAVNRNTRCQCKTDHYCTSFSAGSCKVCDPCTTCGVGGIKEACADEKDTVCNEEKGVIIRIVVSLLIIGIVVPIIIFFLWKKGIIRRGRGKQTTTVQTNGAEDSRDIELPILPVPNIDIQPLLPDISEVLGWKVMVHVARRSPISDAAIESCKLDHQGDSQEQTLQLLKKWVEIHGRASSSELLRMLEEGGKKDKAERIRDILDKAASARSD